MSRSINRTRMSSVVIENVQNWCSIVKVPAADYCTAVIQQAWSMRYCVGLAVSGNITAARDEQNCINQHHVLLFFVVPSVESSPSACCWKSQYVRVPWTSGRPGRWRHPASWLHHQAAAAAAAWFDPSASSVHLPANNERQSTHISSHITPVIPHTAHVWMW